MLDHVSITVSDFAAAELFYDAIMRALGIILTVAFSGFWPATVAPCRAASLNPNLMGTKGRELHLFVVTEFV
jgi:hypothetical protein